MCFNLLMRTVSTSAFRNNLDATLNAVADDHAPMLITRRGRTPPVVLMSYEDYQAWNSVVGQSAMTPLRPSPPASPQGSGRGSRS